MALKRQQKKSGPSRDRRIIRDHEKTTKNINAMATRLYAEVYIGHIPWKHWRKIAKFVLAEKEISFNEGYEIQK